MKNRENIRIRLLLKRNPEEGDSVIRKLFPSRFFETDVVSCAGELEKILDGASPDVVLLDLSNPTLDNRKSFDIARGRHLPPPVIVFGPRKNLSLLTNFLKHGASGMFFIEDDPDVIMHSVRQAAQTHGIRRENDHLKQVLEHRDQTVASLEHVGEAMSTVFDVRRILNLTLKVVRRALDCELCSLFLTDHQSGDLMDSRELGSKAGSPQMSLWKDGGKGRDEMLRNAAALCLERGAMVRINGPEERASLLPSASEVPDGGGIQSLLSVPLKADGGNIGAIVAANRLDGQMFGDRDIDILVSMGRQTALALAGMKRPREEKSFREGLYAQLQVATGKLKEHNIELSRRLKEKEEANRKIKDLAREIAIKNQTLEDMVKRFSVIHEIGQVIGSELEDEKLIRKIIVETAGLLHAETVSVMLLESDGFLRIKHAEGLSPDIIKFTRVAPGDGISGWVAREGKPILIRDVASMKKENAQRTLYHSNSLLCVPLKIKGEVIGVLNVTNRKGGGSFNERDLYLLAILGSHAAVAIENARLYSAIRESYFKTIKALVNAVEAKDTWTKDHSENVTNYSLKIADYLGLSENQKEVIRYAGVLHDIGKIVISSTITDKPSPLTDAEWEKIKEHPLIGQRILDPIDFLEPVKVCIQTHHERCDGSGYPFGLKAHEIPLETRILSVADAFDAMIHSRPYRAALSVENAIDELERFAGTQFDPAVVKGLVRIVEAEEKELSPGP